MCRHAIIPQCRVLTEFTRAVHLAFSFTLHLCWACSDWIKMYFLTICRFFFFRGGWVWGVGLCVCGGDFFIPQQMWRATRLQPTATFCSHWNYVAACGFMSSLTEFMKLLSLPTHTHKRAQKKRQTEIRHCRFKETCSKHTMNNRVIANLGYWTGVTKLFSLFLSSTTELLSVILTPSASGTLPQVRFIKNSKDFSSQL